MALYGTIVNWQKKNPCFIENCFETEWMYKKGVDTFVHTTQEKTMEAINE